MSPIYIDTKHQVFWLSYDFLSEYHIPKESIGNWRKRNICKRKYIDNRAYVDYDTIPEPTRVKLPNKEELKAYYRKYKSRYLIEYFTRDLQEAYSSSAVVQWINIIQSDPVYDKLERGKVTEFARRASVLDRALQIYNMSSSYRATRALYEAYCTVYPDNYSLINRFTMAMKKMNEEGVLSMAVDKRLIIERQPKYGETHIYGAEYLLSLSKAYSIPDCYDMFVEYCQKMKLEIPSQDWLKDYYYANREFIDQARYGKKAYEKESANYAKIIPALNVGDQWQMDGWRIPIYCKKRNNKGGLEYFVTYNLFAVMDAHSRRIVGFDISESENTENILKGLERAVKNTGILPFELVADNHSFNKTKESEYLKEETDRLGMTWTVDSNPRRKAILERAFRTLGDKHFKKQHGYIGQGVKTKLKNGLTQEELMKIYTRPENFLTFDQLAAVTIYVIDQYNNSIRKNLGDTPNNLYANSEQPNAIKISEFDRIALFNRKAEYTVRHGQITIRRGQYVHEYQLPAEHSAYYNNHAVGVRYADFDEIYLYDLETSEPICSVRQKLEIHGAVANQSETDNVNLLKNKGRTTGIETKGRKRKESIFDEANTINPDAYGYLSEISTPKDVLKDIKQNANLRSMLGEFDVKTDSIQPLPKVDEMQDNNLKPRKKENLTPFASNKTEIKKIRI